MPNNNNKTKTIVAMVVNYQPARVELTKAINKAREADRNFSLLFASAPAAVKAAWKAEKANRVALRASAVAEYKDGLIHEDLVSGDSLADNSKLIRLSVENQRFFDALLASYASLEKARNNPGLMNPRAKIGLRFTDEDETYTTVYVGKGFGLFDLTTNDLYKRVVVEYEEGANNRPRVINITKK